MTNPDLPGTVSVGEPCTVPGQFACEGAAQAQKLECYKGSWQRSETCSSGENCDQRSGACAPIVKKCAGKAEGDAYCAGGALNTCGPDLVTLKTTMCEGSCVQGADSAACAPQGCGDGVKQSPETCDDGNNVDTDACPSTCVAATCGDGFAQADVEACDDGNTSNTDGCLNDCKLASCGDKQVQAGVEDCDDGNTATNDACINCVAAKCGDAKLWAGHEECDDGNVVDLDGCSKSCVTEHLEVAVGQFHNCARSKLGAVKCWGFNDFGRLGLGDQRSRGNDANEMGTFLPAVDLGVGIKARSVAAGFEHTCAVLLDGSLKCWGSNGAGQLGLGDTMARGEAGGEMGAALPTVNLGAGRTALSVAAGAYHTCALLDDHSVKCWGGNDSGQLGLGDKTARGGAAQDMSKLPAVDLGTGRTALSIAANAWHTCAILDDKTLKCWGDNDHGSLGQGDEGGDYYRGDAAGEMGDKLKPINLGVGRTARSVDVGFEHVCAVLDNSTLKCWGRNDVGLLGQGDQHDRGAAAADMANLKPIDVGPNLSVVQVATGHQHTCALLNDGSIKCWGSRQSSELGHAYPGNVGDAPGEMGAALLAIDLGTDNLGKKRLARSVDAGSDDTCAVLDNDEVKCWGRNDYGQLGRGNNVNRGEGPMDMGNNLAAVPLW